MKTSYFSLLSLLALCAVGAASAASVQFSSAQIVLNIEKGGTSLLVDRPPVLAMNIAGGGNTTLINSGISVEFIAGNSMTQNGVTASVRVPAGGQQENRDSKFRPAWATMLNTFMVTAFQAANAEPVDPIRFQLSGLTVGQHYRAQFFFGQSGVERRFTIENGADPSNVSEVISNAPDPGRGGWFYTAEWTADSTEQVFIIRPDSNSRAILNGVSLTAF